VENPLPIGSMSSSYLELRRDIGDNVDFYAGFKWDILPYLAFSQEFYYYYKWRDMFDLAYTPLMCELVSQYDTTTAARSTAASPAPTTAWRTSRRTSSPSRPTARRW